jgi:hypothetical protein
MRQSHVRSMLALLFVVTATSRVGAQQSVSGRAAVMKTAAEHSRTPASWSI